MANKKNWCNVIDIFNFRSKLDVDGLDTVVLAELMRKMDWFKIDENCICNFDVNLAYLENKFK